MQTKEELEQWYNKKDPWDYQVTQDDIYRKECILSMLDDKYDKVLDIGMGEGWITKDLPSDNLIYGIELSDNACINLPKNVIRLNEPLGLYDLIICTGVLYEQYDHKKVAEWITNHSYKHVLIAGISSWLKPYSFGKVIKIMEFPYRDMQQKLTLYDCSTAS